MTLPLPPMKHTLLITLSGSLAASAALEWAVALPGATPAEADWQPCLRRPDGRWRLASATDGTGSSPRHHLEPGLFANLALRYRMTAAGPWSAVASERKEIVIAALTPEQQSVPPAPAGADWSALAPFTAVTDTGSLETAAFALSGAASGAVAVAWTEGAVGQTDTAMLVRDPVVVTATVPAFLAPGDRAEAQVRLTHAAGPAGPVGLAVQNTAEVALTAELALEAVLAEGQSADLPLVLSAPDTQGLSQLRLSATLPDGRTVTKDLSLPVERLDPPVTRALRLTLAPGQQMPLDLSPLGAFRPGTGRVMLSTGAFAALDVPAAIAQLGAWPYGCSEQLASAAMPLLYAASLAPEGAPSRPDDAKAVDEAIAQILTRQAPEGGFGLWTAEAGDRWLDAYVTDFLSRARAAGHAVPDTAFRNALSALQNGLNAASDPQFADATENAATAYAAYVLARERAAVVSDLRYYADTGAGHFATPLAAAQLGAALAALGDQTRADAMFRRAQALSDEGREPTQGFRPDYGTLLRDRAGMLALAAEAGSQAVDREGAVAAISAGIEAAQGRLSTQEAAWIVLAAGGGAMVLDGSSRALLVGVVLMVIWYLFPRSKPFFQGRSLNRETPVMVPDEPGDIIRSIDGGI